jgi:hypothetical protein
VPVTPEEIPASPSAEREAGAIADDREAGAIADDREHGAVSPAIEEMVD